MLRWQTFLRQRGAKAGESPRSGSGATWSTNIRRVRGHTRGKWWPLAYDAPGGGVGRYARPAAPWLARGTCR
eukprot:2390917-Prymnesium_polylepis.1